MYRGQTLLVIRMCRGLTGISHWWNINHVMECTGDRQNITLTEHYTDRQEYHTDRILQNNKEFQLWWEQNDRMTPHRMTKRESQAIIAYNAGNLRLKTAWGDYFADKSCLVRMCDQRDNLSHLKRCPFYMTAWRDQFYEDIKLLARWLVALDRERRRRFKGEKLF